jgi:hypothetical protein
MSGAKRYKIVNKMFEIFKMRRDEILYLKDIFAPVKIQSTKSIIYEEISTAYHASDDGCCGKFIRPGNHIIHYRSGDRF